MSTTDIEIGTTRSLATAGRDLVHAAVRAAEVRMARYVARDGRRVAVVLPCGPEDRTPCDAERDAVAGHLAERMRPAFKPGADVDLAQLMGRALAGYFGNGDDVLLTAAAALEELNWHDEAAELRGMMTAEG